MDIKQLVPIIIPAVMLSGCGAATKTVVPTAVRAAEYDMTPLATETYFCEINGRTVSFETIVGFIEKEEGGTASYVLNSDEDTTITAEYIPTDESAAIPKTAEEYIKIQGNEVFADNTDAQDTEYEGMGGYHFSCSASEEGKIYEMSDGYVFFDGGGAYRIVCDGHSDAGELPDKPVLKNISIK